MFDRGFVIRDCMRITSKTSSEVKSEETSEDGNVGGIPGGPAAPAFAKPTARQAPAGRNAPRHPRPYGTTTPSVTGNSFNATSLGDTKVIISIPAAL